MVLYLHKLVSRNNTFVKYSDNIFVKLDILEKLYPSNSNKAKFQFSLTSSIQFHRKPKNYFDTECYKLNQVLKTLRYNPSCNYASHFQLSHQVVVSYFSFQTNFTSFLVEICQQQRQTYMQQPAVLLTYVFFYQEKHGYVNGIIYLAFLFARGTKFFPFWMLLSRCGAPFAVEFQNFECLFS